MFHRQLGRASEADDVRNIFGAAAAIPLLMAADEVGFKSRPSPYIEETDSLRGMKFMAGQRQETHAKIVNVDFQFAGRLHRIRVAEHSPAAANGADFFDRENNAGLVVGPQGR